MPGIPPVELKFSNVTYRTMLPEEARRREEVEQNRAFHHRLWWESWAHKGDLGRWWMEKKHPFHFEEWDPHLEGKGLPERHKFSYAPFEDLIARIVEITGTGKNKARYDPLPGTTICGGPFIVPSQMSTVYDCGVLTFKGPKGNFRFESLSEGQGNMQETGSLEVKLTYQTRPQVVALDALRTYLLATGANEK